MTMLFALPLLLGAPLLPPPPAPLQAFQRRGDAQRAWEDRREGRTLPLAEIERRVVPQMRGAQYLGFDYDSEDGIYTLKFLRDGSVIWVLVDGRSGQVVRRIGN